MVDVQVVLSARDVEAAELSASVQSLLGSVRSVELAHVDEPVARTLSARFGEAVGALGDRRPGVPVLVAPGRVAFALGSVRRIVSQTDVPGRCVTRVFLPGLDDGEHLACWSTSFLRLHEGSLASLVDADLAFDRAHLSTSSPRARSWVPAHAVGVAMVSETGADLQRWSRRTGVALDARRLWASTVRGPAGGVRRRLARRGHRRAGRPAERSVR